MKPLHIIESKRERIRQELEAANGGATEHVFCAQHIFGLAEKSEAKILRYLRKKDAPSARFQAVSGHPVSMAYSYVHTTTEALPERRPTGWLVDLGAYYALNERGATAKLALEQFVDAIS